MKRAFASILLSSIFAAGVLRGADDAVTLAAQQEAQDNYKRLTATVEELQNSQLAQQKQISALASELSKLRDDVARNNNNAAMQDAIRKLNEQILKVDESRIADNKHIQEALERLGKGIKELGQVQAPTRPSRGGGSNESAGGPALGGNTRPPNGGGNSVEDGFDYVIADGDRLDKIVARYREKNIMVTMKAVKDANPKVDWSRLKVGQHIFIPKPK
jgi:septal ring factor EnvC (AmiA/AmiB activator)